MAQNADPNLNDDIIKADPSKAFFIDMLTRDISLEECILDLVDNSIHSLIRESDLDVMQILLGKSPSTGDVESWVSITCSSKDFKIEDTCGGISIQDAREVVFRFGSPRIEKDQTGLGVYGIGMKRAFFKLGRTIVVESRTKNEEFRVDIDVEEWEKDPNWELKFSHAAKINTNGKKPGTTISIKDLNHTVKSHLDQVAFQIELTRRLGSTYALFLKTGLELSLNGSKVKPRLPEFLTSGDLKPVRSLYKEDGVDVLILAGITPRQDKEPHGWYVFCNGRMVLEAEKTELTGWGEGKFPQFHSKYNHFLGLVYFRSKHLRLLPWTTTKDGVEKESRIYQSALGQMRVLAKPITDFLNRLYPQDTTIEARPEFEILNKAGRVSVEALAKEKNTTFLAKPKRQVEQQSARISYTKPLKDVEKVRDALRRPHLTYKQVGEKTFEYFIQKECPK